MMVLTLRIALILAILAAGRNVFHQLMAVQLSRFVEAPEGLVEAIRWDPDGPEYHFRLGVLHRDQPQNRDLSAAQRHLQRAVDLHPYNWGYWLELARLHEISGNNDKAEQAYLQAVDLNPRNALYRWRLANFYLRNDDLEESLAQFRTALQLDFSSYGTAGVSLLWKAGLREPEIERVWPEDPQAGLRLLGLLVGKGAALDFLQRKWAQLLEGGEPPSIEQSHFYLTHLIRTDPGEARRQWARLTEKNGLRDEEFQKGSNFVWNGQFELDRTNSPLDWRIRDNKSYKVKSVETEGVEGSKAIRFDFNGQENLTHVAMEQQLVVEPAGEYELSFQARSEGLSSDQGIYLQIRAGQNGWTSSPLLGTTGWTRYSGTFTVPEGVETAVLRLGRNRSHKIDSLIGGTLWLDSVSLTSQGE